MAFYNSNDYLLLIEEKTFWVLQHLIVEKSNNNFVFLNY